MENYIIAKHLLLYLYVKTLNLFLITDKLYTNKNKKAHVLYTCKMIHILNSLHSTTDQEEIE